MTMTALLAALLLATACALAALALATPAINARRVRARLQPQISAPSRPTEQEGEDQPGLLTRLALRLMLPPSRQLLQRLIGRAGHPDGWTMEKSALLKLGLPLVLGLLLLLVLSGAPSPLLFLIGIVVLLVSYVVPELLLYSRGIERAEQITLELADTLDQMLISVEAGLGFDAAMERAGRNGKGPLAEELVRTLQDMQMGHSRREAYTSLGDRTDVPDLRRFTRAVIQADKHGVGIAGVLHTQADEMRLKRRQRAEHKAMQVPVKVIFPLMLFILPVLFIVIMGPLAIDLVSGGVL
ncbi:secretion system protein [Brachybacterium vulturis]|uniref:Secretion system protein n=1 Tax=Brachybacterium vulturis TaxID=2017484 RepID=A0A291GP70_9MICO|nr:type II secretion system F family protein [Brachybacterium vulturis]ATG51862.1 secretion system protein [Brachybacterium vulturis]